MRYKTPGPTANPGTYAQGIKAMVKIVRGIDIMPDVKMPRKKREYRARGKYGKPELTLLQEIMKQLKHRGCKVWHIENKLRGNKGIPDLLVYKDGGASGCFPPARMTWVEVKAPKGVLSPEQKEFRELCIKAGVRHIIARSVADVGGI